MNAAGPSRKPDRPRPPRKPDPSRRKRRQPASSDSGTVVALVGVILIGGALMGIGAMVMPNLFALPAIGFAFAALIGLQYLIWGYWFDRSLAADDDNIHWPGDDEETGYPQPELTTQPYADEFVDPADDQAN